MKLKAIIILNLLAWVHVAVSQNIQYDPLMDPNVKVLENTVRNGNGEYIWYPGQLSAHLQQKRLKESKARCVNVGYPGNFYKPVNQAYFRKDINSSSETTVQWTPTGKVEVFVNGKEAHTTGNTLKLAKGKSLLSFKVVTEHDLPAIKVTVDGQVSVDGWESSLDANHWNFAETSPVFGTGGRTPLDDPEVAVEINPASILPVRNAKVGNDHITINKNGYILVDFFHLEVGNVSFTAKGDGKITAYVGESPEEAMNDNIKDFEQAHIESYALHEKEMVVTLPERAVRYLRISCDNECEITSVKLKAKIWPVEFMMSFECDNEQINNIWKASVASLHTSTHGFYLDGIKRDYLPWSMDAVLSTFAGDYVFGDEQVSRNSLSVALLPFNPQKADLGIPDYPLHALIGFNQYHKRYGNFNIILSYRDRIEQLLRFYETIQGEHGFISANLGTSWGFVPGWATKMGPDDKGTPAYAQIMLYYNYKIGADFSEKWGDKKAAKHYRNNAEALRKNIMEHFWDDQKGVFINGFTKEGEPDSVISHHAQYWAVLAGIFPENRVNNLFDILPDIPYYRDYVSFEKGYEFLAYAKAGKVREIWDFLQDVFGDWLAQGHTRFPENFSYKATKDEQLIFYGRPYGLSLCHGANGVPGVVGVLNGIAGFSQSEKNPDHYTLRPDIMDLKWANIVFPVKEGIIRLKLSANGEHQVEIPGGCKVDLIRKDNKKITLSKKGIYHL